MFHVLRFKFRDKGFSILEVLISVAIFSIILLAVVSFLLWMRYYGSKIKADSQTYENAKMVLDQIAYELRSAKSIYTPTTTANQLSLETSKYLPSDENHTFIDFFLCGLAICLKKESQNPVVLTSEDVQVTDLKFTSFLNGTIPSVKIDITVDYLNSTNDPSLVSSITLTSTTSLRSY